MYKITAKHVYSDNTLCTTILEDKGLNNHNKIFATDIAVALAHSPDFRDVVLKYQAEELIEIRSE